MNKYLRQNWGKPSLALILTAGALAVAWLLVDTAPDADLPGIWTAQYGDASERLLLYRDHSFVLQISYNHGGRYMANGAWRTARNGRRWDLVLEDALDPFDSIECVLSDQPRSGARDLPIIKDWSDYQLQSCPRDDKHPFKKIGPVRR